MSSLTVQLFVRKCMFPLLPLIENDVLCYVQYTLVENDIIQIHCTTVNVDQTSFVLMCFSPFLFFFSFFRQTSKLLSFKIYLRFVNALFSSCTVSTSPTVKATPNSLPDTQMFLRASQHLRLEVGQAFSTCKCLFICLFFNITYCCFCYCSLVSD